MLGRESSLAITDLSSPEQFILWSLRVALTPATTSATAYDLLDEAFRSVRITEAMPSFLRLTADVNALWHEMQRVPDVHCTCCSIVGHDEWLLLQMLAALQLRDVDLAMKHVNAVLPLGGARLVLPAAMHVAAALGKAGWVLRSMQSDAANAPALARQSFGPTWH